QPDEDACADDQRSDDVHDVARDRVPDVVRMLPLVAPQEQDDADDGGEEDELLTERVEAADVEHRRGDDVRHVTLGRDHAIEDEAVRPAVAAEVRDPRHAPAEQRREAPERRREDREPRAPGHLRPRTRAIATSRMSGYATVETTSIESATSGAPSTTKSSSSIQPYTPATSTMRSTSRVST